MAPSAGSHPGSCPAGPAIDRCSCGAVWQPRRMDGKWPKPSCGSGLSRRRICRGESVRPHRKAVAGGFLHRQPAMPWAAWFANLAALIPRARATAAQRRIGCFAAQALLVTNAFSRWPWNSRIPRSPEGDSPLREFHGASRGQRAMARTEALHRDLGGLRESRCVPDAILRSHELEVLLDNADLRHLWPDFRTRRAFRPDRRASVRQRPAFMGPTPGSRVQCRPSP